MKSLLAFMKKEWMEQVRSGRLLILVIIFILLGVMNPAVAKLTPWLLEMMADSLEASGMTVTAVTVSAMDSWVQFFKNAPMGLIAFILLGLLSSKQPVPFPFHNLPWHKPHCSMPGASYLSPVSS